MIFSSHIVSMFRRRNSNLCSTLGGLNGIKYSYPVGVVSLFTYIGDTEFDAFVKVSYTLKFRDWYDAAEIQK